VREDKERINMIPQLIIAPTIHRAKQIEQEQNNPLAQSLTLDNFIKAVYERYGTKRSIDQDEAKYILAAQLDKVKCYYFDYLTPKSDALDEIVSFFIAVKRNKQTIKAFGYVQEKEEELEALLSFYNAFLEQYHLADQGDVESEVFSILGNNENATKAFGQLVIDNFETNEIHYESSKLQLEILDTLFKRGVVSSPTQSTDHHTAKFYQPSIAPFNQIDEVAASLKIARRLLDEGEKAEEIIIVTTAIDEYAPFFESQLESYGLKGYSSKGTQLRNYLPLIKGKGKNLKDEVLIQAANTYARLKISVSQLHERMTQMGIETNYSELLEKSIDAVRVKERSFEGILLTEPNQLLSKAKIKHLIFMGTDMGHFPPQSKESFLVTQKQKQTLLHGNSIYLSSQNHYLHMKSMADNIYIMTATYKGKTKLGRSMMITEKCEDFDIGAYKAQHELLREKQRIANANIESYLNALQADKLTVYDGLNVGKFTVKSLSASQLNSYAMCPRRYFMSRILGLKAPQESDEGFDAMQKGTIMHRCYELFAKAVKEQKITLGNSVTNALQSSMRDISVIAYQEFLQGEKDGESIDENIHHRLYLQDLQKGLDSATDGEGVLQHFLKYVIANREMLDHFNSSEFEMEFRMDEQFNPVGKDDHYFIRGVIDRIDILEDEIRIVDYKSKKMNSMIDKKKVEQMKELKDMQLALYILFARREYGDKKIESYLQTFKSQYEHVEFAKAATFEVGKEDEFMLYNDVFEERFIIRMDEIKGSIEKGDFRYNDGDEDYCKWCEFGLMCKIK